MAIISISVNEILLKKIDEIKKELGFSGRSDVIRASVRSLISEDKERSSLTGNVEGIISIVNMEEDNENISRIRHGFNDIIKTQLHNHLESHKCLQVFIIKGQSSKVKSFLQKLETCKEIEQIKFIKA